MLCTTTKNGIECFFMSNKGCTFPGGTCKVIVAKCEGCENILAVEDKKFCKAFPDPAAKWLFGSCNLATHIERKLPSEAKKVNPLKASKKGASGKA